MIAKRVGGISLVIAATGFVAVFAFLAVRFNYPDVLDGAADTVLPNLVGMGLTGRTMWAVYALLPLLLIPAGIGVHATLGRIAPQLTRSALIASIISSQAMMLGLARWSTIHWQLAQSYATATSDTRDSIAAVFSGLNLYLGTFLGEFIGELSLNAFFVLSAFAFIRAGWRRIGMVGVVVGVLGLVGAFRNVTDNVSLVADVNNALLPLWLVVMGVTLARVEVPGGGDVTGFRPQQ